MNIEEKVKPYTCLSPARISLLVELAHRAQAIPGDMVECGVYNGGSAAILAHFASNSEKTTWLFDSFQGLPPVTENDVPSVTGISAESVLHDCKGSIDKVKEVLLLVGASMDRVKIFPGWFKDTFPTVDIPKIAMLNLDSDWYESEKICLDKFYDNVSEGGFIYFDDFFYWPGCIKAAMEVFDSRNEYPVFNRVHHAMWLQKGINGPRTEVQATEWRDEEKRAAELISSAEIERAERIGAERKRRKG